MYPLAEVESLRRELGEHSFAALYQGEPRARGMCVFSPAPTFYDPRKVDFTGCIAIIGADPAATARSSADHSVAVAIAVRPRGTPDGLPMVYIVDRLKAQVEVPTFARALVDFQRRNWFAPVAVEAVAGFKAVPQLLRELAPGIRLTEIQPVGDKFTRAQGLAAAWNSGRVLVPLGAPWVDDFVRVLSRFTGTGADREDDDVDAAAHAFNTAMDLTTRARPVVRGAVLALDRWPLSR
jgi:predicted phage terminase large subunit-like protein